MSQVNIRTVSDMIHALTEVMSQAGDIDLMYGLDPERQDTPIVQFSLHIGQVQKADGRTLEMAVVFPLFGEEDTVPQTPALTVINGGGDVN